MNANKLMKIAAAICVAAALPSLAGTAYSASGANEARKVLNIVNFYRANLIMDGTRLVFRDIHKMSDDFEEPFLDKVCTGWQALYYTPPVVEQWMFRGKDASGVMAFDGEFVSIETAADGDVLVVTAKRADGTAATVRFEEGRIVVSGAGSLDAEYADGEFRKTISVADGGVNFVFQGFCYRVPVRGEVKSTAKGFSISGDRIALDLSTADR